MIRSITPLKFTPQGASHLKQSTQRALAFNQLAAEAGVTVEGQLWTTGRHDGLPVLAADREEKILHVLAELAALGNVRPEPVRAFDASEFDAILKG